jgi:hypothetical protein
MDTHTVLEGRALGMGIPMDQDKEVTVTVTGVTGLAHLLSLWILLPSLPNG